MSSDAATPKTLRSVTADILSQEEVLRQGGGPAGLKRQRELGRLPARERVALLLDDPSDFIEIGLWAAYKMYEAVGDVPAAGTVAGIGKIQGRECLIVANDASVKAGAFFPQTCKKVLRAQKIAMQNFLPVIYLVDSAGVFLPMQDEIFPDEDDFGRVFYNNSLLSAMGVPQISAIMGNCVAGGAYLPVLSDMLLMTEGSGLYLAGPALVKAAIGQSIDAENLGGAKMHAEISGTVDFKEPNDESCLKRIRTLVNMWPKLGYAVQATAGSPVVGAVKEIESSELEPSAEPGSAPAAEPERPVDAVYDVVSADGRTEYDLRDLLKSVVDAGSLEEFKPDYGQSLVTAFARIGGRAVGIVGNQKKRTKSSKGELQLGGVIYADSAEKAARFIMDCNQFGVPIIFFQDVTGFMVGRDAEHSGIIRSGAKLVNVVSNCIVPKITVVVGGSFGAGNYALCGKAYDPRFIFAWPNAQYAVMGASQAAGTLFTIQQKAQQKKNPNQNDDELEKLRDKVKQDYERQTDIRYGAARGWVDAIIAPHTTRDVLIHALRWVTRPKPAGQFKTGVLQV